MVQRGVRDKMQRGSEDKKPEDPEERRKRLEGLRRERQLRTVYRERYPALSHREAGPDRTADQIAVKPGVWESA